MSGMMKIVMAIIGVTVALILFPIIITQANVLWTAAGTTYTGMQSLVAVAPLIILVGLVVGSGFMGYSGVKTYRKSRKRR